MKAIRLETQSKWDSLGFLEGLKGHVKENIAQLYENQASTLLSETTTATLVLFETVVFPIVRRVFSKLLANDIVSVQAMNMPIGKLFYFVPQTSSRNDGQGGYVTTITLMVVLTVQLSLHILQWVLMDYQLVYNQLMDVQ
jgi:hypothetical protein